MGRHHSLIFPLSFSLILTSSFLPHLSTSKAPANFSEGCCFVNSINQTGNPACESTHLLSPREQLVCRADLSEITQVIASLLSSNYMQDADLSSSPDTSFLVNGVKVAFVAIPLTCDHMPNLSRENNTYKLYLTTYQAVDLTSCTQIPIRIETGSGQIAFVFPIGFQKQLQESMNLLSRLIYDGLPEGDSVKSICTTFVSIASDMKVSANSVPRASFTFCILSVSVSDQSSHAAATTLLPPPNVYSSNGYNLSVLLPSLFLGICAVFLLVSVIRQPDFVLWEKTWFWLVVISVVVFCMLWIFSRRLDKAEI